jgi:hypothetical protein
MGVFTALLILLSLPQEDLSKQVAGLVERLGSDEIDQRERATAELVKLGAPALDIIKAQRAAAAGEVRNRLERVVLRIERAIRCDTILGPAVTVTLKADKRPLPEVLEDLKRQGKQSIEWKDLPSDPVTVSLDKTPLWKALDEVCKAHGGVMWRGEPGRVLVERAPYRAMPKLFDRNFLFYLSKYTDDVTVGRRGASRYHNLHAGLLWTGGAGPSCIRLRVDELKDDKGTDLLTGVNPDIPWGVTDIESPGLLHAEVSKFSPTIADWDATRLTVCRGAVLLQIVLESKRILEIKEPEKNARGQHDMESLGVWVQDFNRSGDKLTSTVRVTLRGGQKKDSVRPSYFGVLDSKGTFLAARGHAGAYSAGVGDGPQVWISLEWNLPAGTELSSFELHIPSDVHELEIPFEFRDLPLK